jgi:enamine deaminase RidA (YjgF/YER057c/UK114 family)
MGGKNALIVFADCDLELAVEGAVRAAFLNSGQICLCPERILVQRTSDGFHERFRDAFVQKAQSLVVGDPQSATTDVGPLISRAQYDKIQAYTELAQQEGGRVLCGGPAPGLEEGGNWWAPTVVAGCAIDSRAACEEVFGPFVTIHEFENDEEAVSMANGTKYGLAASVWSENVSRAHDVASRIDAGTVWVNCWLHRQLHMPFGGVKHSGVSREGGLHSLDFYSEVSTVCMKIGNRAPPPMPGSSAQWQQQQQQQIGTSSRGFSTTSSTATSPPSVSTAVQDEGFVPSAPKPMGAYPHARRVGNLLYLAGIGPRDAATDSVPGGPIEDGATGQRRDYDVAAQTRQCIANVEEVLAASNMTLNNVVDVHAFLVDMKRDFKTFNAAYAEKFAGLPTPPTRTTVEVRELPPGGRIGVELKCVAAFPES